MHQLAPKLDNTWRCCFLFFFFLSRSLSNYWLLHSVFVGMDCAINIPTSPLQVMVWHICTRTDRLFSSNTSYAAAAWKTTLLEVISCYTHFLCSLSSVLKCWGFFLLLATIFYTYRTVWGVTMNTSLPCCLPLCCMDRISHFPSAKS